MPDVNVTDENVSPKKKESRIKEILSILLSSKTAMVGLAIVLFWVFVAIFAPLLTDYTPYDQDWKAPNEASIGYPSVAYSFGAGWLYSLTV